MTKDLREFLLIAAISAVCFAVGWAASWWLDRRKK